MTETEIDKTLPTICFRGAKISPDHSKERLTIAQNWLAYRSLLIK